MNIGKYLDVTGGRIWYDYIGKDKPGIPLVILHGGPGFPHNYLRSLERLADDRPILFYDQLGCGRSDRPDNLHLWSVERFVEELGQLRKHLALEQLHILGHSWGTMLAVDYALVEPQGITSLILASPAINISRWLSDADQNRLKLPQDVQDTMKRHEKAGTTDSPEYVQASAVYMFQFICRVNPLPEEVLQAAQGDGSVVYKTMWGASEFYMKGSRLEHYNRENKLKELSMPTLFTCGRYDEASPEASAAYQAQMPQSKLAVFENSAHMPHLEEREAYIQCVRDFLAPLG